MSRVQVCRAGHAYQGSPTDKCPKCYPRAKVIENPKRSATFEKLKTWEPFSFPLEPEKRLIKTGKRTFRPEGSSSTSSFTVDRMTRTVTRKPWKNPDDRREEMLDLIAEFMDENDLSDLDMIEAVADMADDPSVRRRLLSIIEDELGTGRDEG